MDIELVNQLDADVSHQVSSVSFRYYSPDEIKALSVCQITRERAFDDLGRPVKRGLYDPALGITSFSDGTCNTCGMNYTMCPGHFGHIELPFPLVNPMLVRIVSRLLQTSCWSCGTLNQSKKKLRILLMLLRFEDAQLFNCVEAIRYYSTANSSDSSTSERDVFKSSFQYFLDRLPQCIKRHLEGVDISNLDEVDSAFEAAAKKSWEDAAKTRNLASSPSDRWREFIKAIEEKTKKCPLCNTPTVKLRVGKAGRFCTVAKGKETVVLPTDIYKVVKNLWTSHKELFSLLYGQQGRLNEGPLTSLDYHVFFIKNVAVPPSRFRPAAKVGTMEMASEHPQNLCFSGILEGISTLAEYKTIAYSDGQTELSNSSELVADNDLLDPELGFLRPKKSIQDVIGSKKMKDRVTGQAKIASRIKSERDLLNAIGQIQEGVAFLYDNEPSKQVPIMGVRQQLEAKQGLFRMHMMGKRVNFSCRSVIGPDMFIATNEVGIPESFAKLLSVPEFVNAQNCNELRDAVLNGPLKHPGALAVEQWTDSGHHRVTMLKAPTKLSAGNLNSQAQLLMPNSTRISDMKSDEVHRNSLTNIEGASKIVDPELEEFSGKGASTLPRRVLRHLRTGDIVLFNRQPTLHRASIMAHRVRVLPGDRTIRFHYANCGSYNADFDGDEMNVHILQDPLARAEAEELMLSSRHYIVPTSGAPIRGLIQDHIAAAALLSSRDTFLRKEEFCQLLFSATEGIVTGSSPVRGRYRVPMPVILKPIPLWTGKQLISTLLDVIREGRPGLNLETTSKTKSGIIGEEESRVLFRNGELIRGILDKGSIGATIYGAVHGIQELYGTDASDNFLGAFGKLGTFFLRHHGHTTGIEDLILDYHAEQARRKILKESIDIAALSATKEVSKALGVDNDNSIDSCSNMDHDQARSLTEHMVKIHGAQAEDRLDTAMNTALNKILSEVTNSCLPDGLKKKFPKNGFALMTNTGAKGGAVNSAQISCLVGSTVLEGKRVPRIGGSGSTLPCFLPYDASPNAGGFIAGRFLTGIAPFEFFFHAMAGREGLLDTSLKTANSGYLQRCLVKAMEGVKLNYDYTVRDSDGSVIQFLYGDDGLDPCKASWLSSKIDWQVSNLEALLKRSQRRHPAVAKYYQARLEDMNIGTAYHQERPSTLLEDLSPGVFAKSGAVSEFFQDRVEKFLLSNPQIESTKVRAFLESRYQRCVAEPGEPVGIIAAQSVGEPSTQMTLNTFHHAGSSSAHVTLGIPRLRELLMTASKYPKTPSMTLPILQSAGKAGADKVTLMLNEVELMDLLTAIEIENKHVTFAEELGGIPIVLVSLKLSLHKPELYESALGFSFDHLLKIVETDFQDAFVTLLKKHVARAATSTDEGVASLMEVAGAIRPNYVSFDSEGKESTLYDRETGTNKNGEEKDRETNEAENDLREKTDELDDKQSKGDDSDSENSDSSSSSTDSLERSESLREGTPSDLEGVSNGTSIQECEQPSPKLDGEQSEVRSNFDNAKFETSVVSGIGPLCEPEGSEDGGSIELKWIIPVCIAGRIRLTEIVEEVAKNVKLVHVDNITKCFLESKDDGFSVVTEGSNLSAIFSLGNNLIDFDRLKTNDMFGILNTYGVEALREALIEEFCKVFKVYGIPVNLRHLMLIADYMTFFGGYRGFNRKGIQDSPSTFQKITFETSSRFLADATLFGIHDPIANPSSAIAVGATYSGGTGGVDLLQSI